jgi:hypothetical protein
MVIDIFGLDELGIDILGYHRLGWDATYNLFSIQQIRIKKINNEITEAKFSPHISLPPPFLSLSLSFSFFLSFSHTHTHTHTLPPVFLMKCNRTPTFHRWSFEARSERLKFERRSFASQLHSYQPNKKYRNYKKILLLELHH